MNRRGNAAQNDTGIRGDRRLPERMAFALTTLFVLTVTILALYGGYHRAAITEVTSARFSLDFPSLEDKSTARETSADPVMVNLYDFAREKKSVRPFIVEITADAIRNTAATSYRVRLSLVGNDYPVTWVSRNDTWSQSRRAFTRPVRPGDSVGMRWRIALPVKKLDDPVVMNGGIAIIDDTTGRWIGYIPVNIFNSESDKPPVELECCD